MISERKTPKDNVLTFTGETPLHEKEPEDKETGPDYTLKH